MPGMAENQAVPTGETTFPRQQARTMRFRVGVPRAFTLAPDGSRVAFLRTRSGTDRAGCLWVLDLDSRTERVVADPADLLDAGAEELSPEERARRERAREGGAGVVGYSTHRSVRTAAFALSSRLFVSDLVDGSTRVLASATPVVDPRPDPTGRHVAYVADGALHVINLGSGDDSTLATPE